jgi:Tfp pilus assembly protein FimT
MNTKTRKRQTGFTTIQLLITIVIAAIVTTFAAVGITSARAHMRRSSSARQFAAMAERARSDSMRRHATSGQQSGIVQVNETTYAVTMDFSGTGTVTTQNFSAESGVALSMPRAISFDWRGRIPTETNVVFTNTLPGSVAVNVSGSGDVTLDLDIFADASVPHPTLSGTGSGVNADPSPSPGTSPYPSPSPSPSATPTDSPTPTPTPTATPSATPTATPTASPTATATPSATPTATATPVQCTLSTSATTITISQNGSAAITAHLNNYSGSATLSAASSNNGQIQVDPSSATVSGSANATFTISVKKSSGSVTISSSCGDKEITVTVP